MGCFSRAWLKWGKLKKVRFYSTVGNDDMIKHDNAGTPQLSSYLVPLVLSLSWLSSISYNYWSGVNTIIEPIKWILEYHSDKYCFNIVNNSLQTGKNSQVNVLSWNRSKRLHFLRELVKNKASEKKVERDKRFWKACLKSINKRCYSSSLSALWKLYGRAFNTSARILLGITSSLFAVFLTKEIEIVSASWREE